MKSLYKAFQGLVVAVGLSGAVMSCKPSIPSEYLSKGEMTDILYDIHVAEAMASYGSRTADSAIMISYREAVLKKHGVSAADFDSSMVYYMRHTKLMYEIYKDLGDSLTADAKSLGADVDDASRFGTLASGDTANVWKGAHSMVLSVFEPFNYQTFEVPVDSGFHKGDKLMLDFDAQFLFQEGMRDGVAILAVTFQNDSVCSRDVRVSNSQHYSQQIEDHDSLGIKSIKGYFLLNSGDYSQNGSSLTTLKMMFIQNIKLIRMHQKPQPAPQPSENPSDSVEGGAKPKTADAQNESEKSAVAPQESNGAEQEFKPVHSAPVGQKPLPPIRMEKMRVLDEKKK